MTKGKIIGICISSEHGKVPNLVDSVKAIPGRGLENDRYFSIKDEGNKDGQELTLIESEKIMDFNKKFSTNFDNVEFRRNIITQNISLNELVGREFYVGKVKVRGINLCEPCLYLQKKLNNSNFVKEFTHKSGLRAQILTEGIINNNDIITD